MTVAVEAPEALPEVARIVALPGATRVTRPLVETVATAALDVEQVKPVDAFGGDAVALSCNVPFTRMLADDGVTVTDFTPGPPRASAGSVGAPGPCSRSVHEMTSANAATAVTTEGIRVRVRELPEDRVLPRALVGGGRTWGVCRRRTSERLAGLLVDWFRRQPVNQ